jgi:hypothetical protein
LKLEDIINEIGVKGKNQNRVNKNEILGYINIFSNVVMGKKEVNV